MSSTRTSFADFAAETLTRGSILGIKRGSTISQVDSIFGESIFIDDVDRRGVSMRRDYGLVELGLNSDLEHDWICFSAKLQIHRLRWGTTVPEPIAVRVGEISEILHLTDLECATGSHGPAFHQEDSPFTDFSYFYVSDPWVRITVVAESIDDVHTSGTIWQIEY